MKNRFLLLFFSLTFFFGAKAQVPTTSTVDNSVWYYISAPFGEFEAKTYATAQGPNGLILNSALKYTDSQLWRVVVNGQGFALQNKAFNTYLNTDLEDYASLILCNSLPTIQLQFTPSTFVVGAVHVENVGVGDPTSFLLCAGKAEYSWGWANYYDESHLLDTSYKFVPESEASTSDALGQLYFEIITATDLINSVQEGNSVGQYPTSAKSALQSAINTATNVVQNSGSTVESMITAIRELDQKMILLQSSCILPTSSTTSAPIWYLIKSASKPEYAMSGKYLSASLVNDGVDITSNEITDEQLWRFEKQANGNFYIFNKSKGKYLDNILCNSDTGVEFLFSSRPDGCFTVNKMNTQLLHADKIGVLVNWADADQFQSRWAIELYSNTATTTIIESTDKVRVFSIHGRINVVGTESSFKIYDLRGKLMKSDVVLQSGIYVVKVLNKSYKVVVE